MILSGISTARRGAELRDWVHRSCARVIYEIKLIHNDIEQGRSVAAKQLRDRVLRRPDGKDSNLRMRFAMFTKLVIPNRMSLNGS